MWRVDWTENVWGVMSALWITPPVRDLQSLFLIQKLNRIPEPPGKDRCCFHLGRHETQKCNRLNSQVRTMRDWRNQEQPDP